MRQCFRYSTESVGATHEHSSHPDNKHKNRKPETRHTELPVLRTRIDWFCLSLGFNSEPSRPGFMTIFLVQIFMITKCIIFFSAIRLKGFKASSSPYRISSAVKLQFLKNNFFSGSTESDIRLSLSATVLQFAVQSLGFYLPRPFSFVKRLYFIKIHYGLRVGVVDWKLFSPRTIFKSFLN